MKIRNGFVANSSSTSFCIIGTYSSKDIKELVKYFKIGEEYTTYGAYSIYLSKNKDIVTSFYGSDTLEYSNYFGIRAERLLNTMTIPEAKKYFIDLVKEETEIDLEEYCVGFYYGEVGDN